MVEEMFEYGIRQGLPRLMKQFRKYGWQWTTWACGRALEVTQPYAKMMIEDGHEVSTGLAELIIDCLPRKPLADPRR